MTEPSSEWRVRAGVGLLAAGGVPMSDERREIIARETEREAERDRRAAELAAQQQADAIAERRWELQRQGAVPRTQEEFLTAVSFAQDRQDAVEARREREAAEILGKPTRNPDHTLYALTAAAAAKREVEATEPATLVDVRREVEKETSGLKIALWKLKHGKG